MTRARIIAVWSSKLGKYWFHLINNGNGTYSYVCDDGGGYMGYLDNDAAHARAYELLETYAADGIAMKRRG